MWYRVVILAVTQVVVSSNSFFQKESPMHRQFWCHGLKRLASDGRHGWRCVVSGGGAAARRLGVRRLDPCARRYGAKDALTIVMALVLLGVLYAQARAATGVGISWGQVYPKVVDGDLKVLGPYSINATAISSMFVVAINTKTQKSLPPEDCQYQGMRTWEGTIPSLPKGTWELRVTVFCTDGTEIELSHEIRRAAGPQP
jgi:hypothetical protein